MKTGHVLFAIGLGAFLGVVVVCGGLGTGFLVLVRQELRHLAPEQDVAYVLHGPARVRVGEPAVLTVEVTNTSTTDTRELYSLDLYTDLVDQGSFSASPAASNQYVSSGSAYAELHFGKPLAPGETATVDVTFHPTQPGQYEINIDACIESAHNFIARYHTLEVEPVEESEDVTDTAGES